MQFEPGACQQAGQPPQCRAASPNQPVHPAPMRCRARARTAAAVTGSCSAATACPASQQRAAAARCMPVARAVSRSRCAAEGWAMHGALEGVVVSCNLQVASVAHIQRHPCATGAPQGGRSQQNGAEPGEAGRQGQAWLQEQSTAPAAVVQSSSAGHGGWHVAAGGRRRRLVRSAVYLRRPARQCAACCCCLAPFDVNHQAVTLVHESYAGPLLGGYKPRVRRAGMG